MRLPPVIFIKELLVEERIPPTKLSIKVVPPTQMVSLPRILICGLGDTTRSTTLLLIQPDIVSIFANDTTPLDIVFTMPNSLTNAITLLVVDHSPSTI